MFISKHTLENLKARLNGLEYQVSLLLWEKEHPPKYRYGDPVITNSGTELIVLNEKGIKSFNDNYFHNIFYREYYAKTISCPEIITEIVEHEIKPIV